jgi:hypothetical protein
MAIPRRSPADPGAQLRRASSYPGGLISSFREDVVLACDVMQVLLDAGRQRFGSQLAHARRVIAVVRGLHQSDGGHVRWAGR